jgi:uncharacterized protein YabN with tetrapyrrole methylase and pyrophosphatase domain
VSSVAGEKITTKIEEREKKNTTKTTVQLQLQAKVGDVLFTLDNIRLDYIQNPALNQCTACACPPSRERERERDRFIREY